MLPVPARVEGSLRIASLNLWSTDREPSSRTGELEDRWQSLQAWVSALEADVLCCQEVAVDTLPMLDRLLVDTHLCHAFVPGVEVSDSALLSRWPLRDEELLLLPRPSGEGYPQCSTAAVAAVDLPWSLRMFAVSSHLAWGPLNEGVRLRQVEAVDNWARQFGEVSAIGAPLVAWGMDMNCEPGSVTARWLAGRDVFPDGSLRSTLWTSAWDSAAVRHGDGVTSSPANRFARRTAREHRAITRPELLPERRIDFLWLRGYRFGSPGSPLAAGTWGVELPGMVPPSDHHGVWADLLMP